MNFITTKPTFITVNLVTVLVSLFFIFASSFAKASCQSTLEKEIAQQLNQLNEELRSQLKRENALSLQMQLTETYWDLYHQQLQLAKSTKDKGNILSEHTLSKN